MKPNKVWRVGDPIGGGEIYIPDIKTKNAYGKACRDALIDSAARHVLSLSNLTLRRSFISKQPLNRQDDLKMRITELWKETK